MNDKQASSQDKFENGYFWQLYRDLESQFQNFLEYVPYFEGNEKVYSFRLLNLVLCIGGHVDSALKEMARYPRFAGNKECMRIYELINLEKRFQYRFFCRHLTENIEYAMQK